jgi:hypothetical protein
MLEKGTPEMPFKTQADLLGISYSSLFFEPVLPSVRELALNRRIDEIDYGAPSSTKKYICVTAPAYLTPAQVHGACKPHALATGSILTNHSNLF